MTPRAEEFRRLAERGWTAKEAAAHMGVTRQAARQVAVYHGFRFRTEAEATLARLRYCAERGLTLTQAAASMKRNRKHLDNVAKAHGIEFAGRNNRRALSALTPNERAFYAVITKNKRIPGAEALRIVLADRAAPLHQHQD